MSGGTTSAGGQNLLRHRLDDDSKKFVTVNTHKGLFRYNRLPFGVSSAPATFKAYDGLVVTGNQACMHLYIDDILVTSESESEHLDEVLKRLKEAGVTLKRSKCYFLQPEVEYLGHKVSKAGLSPTDAKVRAILEAPAPENVFQLRSFLGLLNYYGILLPSLFSTLAPLHTLLAKGKSWSWEKPQQVAFEKAKKLLTSSKILAHYDSKNNLVLACDASSYGVGAVLSHRDADGTEQPIAFVSRTLATAKRNYSQLNKEGLAIVFAVKRFHNYVMGRSFVICLDHKPLQHLFGEKQGIPAMASARLQRWALILSAYQYTIEYKAGKQNANADSLSRLPLPDIPVEVPVTEETVFLMDTLPDPVSVAQN